MSTMIDPINQAARIATLFFSVVREGKEVFVSETGMNDASKAADGERILSAISDLSRQLERATSSIVGAVGQKFEQEQYEKLGSTVKAVKLALEMRSRVLLAPSIASLSEQVERAKNRLDEGKSNWFGPWLAGESVRLIGMHALVEDAGGRQAVQRLAAELRENVLEYSRDTLEERRRLPWRQIADFVKGESEEILSLIGDESSGDRQGREIVILSESQVMGDSAVSEITAHVGQRINVGDVLVILEADKVTYEIKAEHAGTIKKVFINVGDKLAAGDKIFAVSQIRN